jgi:uncharacterized surface anchored protein
VFDANQAAIPGASLELTSTETNEKRDVKAGDNGEFVITTLRPGKYLLRITAQGFASRQAATTRRASASSRWMR